jgi:hypothetical protein
MTQDTGQAVIEPPAIPAGMLGAFNALLRHPASVISDAREGARTMAPARLFLGALACYAAYGAAAGLFQGGSQAFLAAVKTPLVVLTTLILCAPSFYVFGTLAGADLSGRRFLNLMAGFAGMLGMLLLALLPISWLFTVSSTSLLFVVLLHALVWSVALVFAFRFLSVTLARPAAHAALFLWLILFSIVSCQVTTYLRPILWREAGTPVFRTEKLFFLEHLGQVARTGTPAGDRTGY